MTVKELKRILLDFPDDLEIVASYKSHNYTLSNDSKYYCEVELDELGKVLELSLEYNLS